MAVTLRAHLTRRQTARNEPQFFKAVSEGEREFEGIAIVGGKGTGRSGNVCAPCGVCRQVMQEFCRPDEFYIVLEDGKGGWNKYLLKELLPLGFGPENLR